MINRWKKNQKERKELLHNFDSLEKAYKKQPSIMLKEELTMIKAEIQCVDVHLTAKDIMYAKQRMFEFQDRPGKIWQKYCLRHHRGI